MCWVCIIHKHKNYLLKLTDRSYNHICAFHAAHNLGGMKFIFL